MNQLHLFGAINCHFALKVHLKLGIIFISFSYIEYKTIESEIKSSVVLLGVFLSPHTWRVGSQNWAKELVKKILEIN